MATIQDVIQNNNWKSSDFLKSTAANGLFTTGVLRQASDAAQAMVNAVSDDNVQSKIKTGLVGFDFEEQNLGSASGSDATPVAPTFGEVDVKTFYGNQWFGITGIQKDLMASTKPNQLVNETVGKYWAEQFNRLASATISGLSDVSEITVGDGTANFSRSLVNAARKLKGDAGYGKLANMYMSSTTMGDILDKQAAGTIPELITEKYDQYAITENGVTRYEQSATPRYVFANATTVVVDDTMTDGVISLVEQGAIAVAIKEHNRPMLYANNPLANNGAGKEAWGVKATYILHPVGFKFVGVKGTDYASDSGLTIAELQAGGLYELAVDVKNSPILNIKVKLG